MKKKQILKNIEKNTKDNKSKGEKDVFFKFITTLVVLVLLGILVYFLIGVFYTKEIDFKSDNKKDTKEDVTIDNSTITLGQIFDQAEDEYYVLVYDVNDDKSIIPTWMQVFTSNNRRQVFILNLALSKKPHTVLFNLFGLYPHPIPNIRR